MPRTHSPAAELRGAFSLVGQLFEDLTERVHEFHRAISDLPVTKVPGLLGAEAATAPVRTLHDSITDGVYLGVRLGGGALFKAAATVAGAFEKNALSPLPLGVDQPVEAPPGWRADTVAAISGLVGDDMARRRNPLTPVMGVYQRGRRVSLTPQCLAAAYPEASGRIVVFMHGLCGNERTWGYFQRPDDAETTPYSERLRTELGYTPVMLRYNTGLHISRNGRTAARRLAWLVAGWPVPVTEITLVGHSMGGLLARSLVHAASEAGMEWTASLRHVICLGSPHLGAPLERFVEGSIAKLSRFDLSRPLAKVLDNRSVGIRDLGHGYVLDADWKGRERASLNAECRTPFPRLATARYHFVGTTFGSGPDSRFNETIGDGLVQLSSATAAHVADADTAVLFNSHHLRLLNHPGVYTLIRARLSGEDAPAIATEAVGEDALLP